MAYKVLARKFRPGTFDEVVGQDAVVRTLRNAIAGGRMAHAYLFSGARGVGKTTLARILAKCLNCKQADGPTVTPCGTCESCLEVAESTSLDVQEIDGASNRGIDDIRELRETSRYQPSRDRFRVFIIDEVHMLTREAFNALLKTLEEPPPHVVFVFATTEYQKVPATIVSRCQHFDFRRIERTTLAATLARVAEQEGVTLGDRGADLLARTASGSLRDALGYLDQAVAYCGAEVSEAGLREILGVAGRESVDAFFQALADSDAAAAIGLIDRLARSGQDLAHFCRELIERGRELLLLRASPEAVAVLGMTESEAAEAGALAERFSAEDLLRIGRALTDLEGKMRFSPHTRFLLEMAAVRLIRTGSLTPLPELIARVEALAGGSSGGGSPPPAGGRKATPKAGGKVQAAPPPGGPRVPLTSERAAMGAGGGGEAEIRRRVSAKRNALGSYLEHACEFRVAGDELRVRFPSQHALFMNGLARADNRRILGEAVLEVTGKELQIDVGIADDEPAGPTVVAAADPRDDLMAEAMEEPVVRAFMDRFRARVVRVEEVKPS
ncbi:MAG: DNA polymerase III subunit gamma/tau [Acidobacteriota bacterium]